MSMDTINEPDVTVTDVEKIKMRTYGNLGKIALIGAFPSTTFQIGSFTGVTSAKRDLKGDASTVPSACVSYPCLDYIYNQCDQSKGAEDIIIVNTNYGADTPSYTIDNGKLASALSILQDEDFDILTIADEIILGTGTNLNPMWNTLYAFVNSQYRNQKPFGIITGVKVNSTDNPALLTAFKNLWSEKGIFKAVTTPVWLKGTEEPLNIAESGCWHSAFTAGRAVNKSETSKKYNDLQGVDTKSLFPVSDVAGTIDWIQLLDNGFHTMKYHNRRLSTIKCINNITPHGWDMKVERVKNYMIKRLTFADVFGEDNNNPSLDFVKGLFEYEKLMAMKNNYITDMQYEITHCAQDCIRARLFLEIPDVIRHAFLEVSVEITPYVEA